MKNYTNLLEKAIKIADDRQKSYGPAERSVGKAVAILDVAFNINLSKEQFCLVLASLKLARSQDNNGQDSVIDLVNYLCMARAFEEEENAPPDAIYDKCDNCN